MVKGTSKIGPQNHLAQRQHFLVTNIYKNRSIKGPGLCFQGELAKVRNNPHDVEKLLECLSRDMLFNGEIQKVIETEIRNDPNLSTALKFTDRLGMMKSAMQVGDDTKFDSLCKFFEGLCLDNKPIIHELTQQFKECRAKWEKASGVQKEKYGQILWLYSRAFRWTASTQQETVKLLIDCLDTIDHMDVKLYAMGGLGKAMARIYADSLIEKNPKKKKELIWRSEEILGSILKMREKIKHASSDMDEKRLFFNVNHMQEVIKVLTGDFDNTSKGGENTYCLSDASLKAIYEIITGADELPFIRERAALFLKEMGDNPDLSKKLSPEAAKKAQDMFISLQYHPFHEVRAIYDMISGVALIEKAFNTNPSKRNENIIYAMGILGIEAPQTKFVPQKTNELPKTITNDEIIMLSNERKRGVLGENYDALSLVDGDYYIKKELLSKVPGKVDFPVIAALNELLAVDVAVKLLGMPQESINEAVLILDTNGKIVGTLSKYAGEFAPYDPDFLNVLKQIKANGTSDEDIAKLLLTWRDKITKEAYDLDKVKEDLPPEIRNIIRATCTYRMSTYDIKDNGRGRDYFGFLGIIFNSPSLFDQIRTLDQIIGNEDRLGPRNFLFTHKENPNKPQRQNQPPSPNFQIKVIDHNKAFIALARDRHLMGTEHLMGFKSFLRRGVDGSCNTFHENIKPMIEGFAEADHNLIIDILNKYYGSSSPISWSSMAADLPNNTPADWPEAIFRLLVAEQNLIKKFYLRWAESKWRP